MNNPKLYLAICLLIPMLALATGKPKFSGFEVTSHEDPQLKFQFSAADASEKSPIVITAPGRELTKQDGGDRVDLQKYWLSVNVPKTYKLQDRSLVTCPKIRDRDYFGACDEYVFLDPKAGKTISYFIYVGNWP